MKTLLFSIFDKIQEEYSPIFHAKNEKAAIRNFLNLMKTKSELEQNDYKLVILGNFDTETGIIANTLTQTVEIDEKE